MSLKFYLTIKNKNIQEQKLEKQSSGKNGFSNGFSLAGNNGSTVFLIHGLTGTPNEMRFLANFFNKRMGYNVVCPRLANHGEPINILKKTTWQDCYQSVREAFLHIRDNKSGPLFVSGLSMGALLALLLGEEYSGRISGITCLSPTLFYDGWNIPWYSSLLLPVLYATPLKHITYFKEKPPYGFKNEALSRRVHKHFYKAKLNDPQSVERYGYPYFPLTLLHQLSLLVKYLTKLLPSIRMPVQIIQAKNDDMTSIRNSKFILDRINSETKELVLLNDSYHVITADQERDTVALKMHAFYSQIISSIKK
jgi:carboxylesterase